MSNINIRNKWQEFNNKYSFYFKSNEDIWINNLKKVCNYIDNNNKRPTGNTKLAYWVSTQLRNSNNLTNIINNNKTIHNLFNEFINRYKIHFKPDDVWKDMLLQLQNYIDINKKFPTEKSNKKLFLWSYHELNIYRNKERIDEKKEIYLMNSLINIKYIIKIMK